MTSSPTGNRFPRFDFLDAEFDRLTAEAERSEAAGHRRFVGIGIAAVATVSAVVAAVTLIGAGGDQPLGISPAQAALHRFADDAVANSEGLTAEAGQFLYQRQNTDTNLDFSFDPQGGDLVATSGPGGRETVETWIDQNGNGLSRNEGLTRDFSNGPASFGGQLDLTYDQVLDLPRDPAVLLARLQDLESDASGGIVGTIGTLLDTPLPPDLQSALLDAAALVPEADLVGDIDAPSGETLTAISFDVSGGNGVRYELLFDPLSGSYRGHAIVSADGQRFYGSLILERGVVDQAGSRP
jgi:hypothetical protein